MKKYCTLFFLFCVASLIPLLCHASDWDFDSDGDVDGKDLYFLTGTFLSDDLEPFAAVYGSLKVTCGAYVAPGVWKEFDCYNLGAVGSITDDDPFTPSWRSIGNYWQWGRKDYAAPGPIGPGEVDANSGAITGWSQTHAPNGSWSDAVKTANDPCPAGYRVPTQSQWQGVVTNNPQSIVGIWSTTWDNNTNYSAARFFGDGLMLPAAGYRYYSDGSLTTLGGSGVYWSSTEGSDISAWTLYLLSSYAGTDYGGYRRYGFSVRCVKE